jgi:hypothetical protein
LRDSVTTFAEVSLTPLRDTLESGTWKGKDDNTTRPDINNVSERCRAESYDGSLSVEDLLANMRQLQEHAFRQFGSPHWKHNSNKDSRHGLNSLETLAKKRAKAYSIPTIQEMGRQTISSAPLMKTLANFTSLGAGMSLDAFPTGKAWVLVQAYLMHRIYQYIYDKPFFGFDILLAILRDTQRISTSSLVHDDILGGASASSFTSSVQVLYDTFMHCKISLVYEECILTQQANRQ